MRLLHISFVQSIKFECRGLRQDDALLLLGNGCLAWKLRSQKLNECARARSSVRAQPPETEKEHQEVENVRVLQWGEFRMLPHFFFLFLNELRQGRVKTRGYRILRRLFVVDSGQQCAAGLRQ